MHRPEASPKSYSQLRLGGEIGTDFRDVTDSRKLPRESSGGAPLCAISGETLAYTYASERQQHRPNME
jgi:hypothetical protein